MHVLGRLVAARTGHGDFAGYHERFKHEDALMACSCGAPKAPAHFIHCPKATRRWSARQTLPVPRRIANHPGELSEWILSTLPGALAFKAFIDETNFFSEICPRG